MYLILTIPITTCGQCGADLSLFSRDMKVREGRLPDKLTHPWFHDAQVLGQQRLWDEAADPKGSPWRYNDITTDEG